MATTTTTTRVTVVVAASIAATTIDYNDSPDASCHSSSLLPVLLLLPLLLLPRLLATPPLALCQAEVGTVRATDIDAHVTLFYLSKKGQPNAEDVCVRMRRSVRVHCRVCQSNKDQRSV